MSATRSQRLLASLFADDALPSVDQKNNRLRAYNPAWLVVGVSLWMAVVANLPLWRELFQLRLINSPSGAAFAMGLASIIAATLTVLCSLLAWRWTLKPLLTLLLIAAAFGAHFMLSYGVVIDTTMMTNALQTDAREATGLLNLRLMAIVFVLGIVPSLVIWRLPLAYGPWARRLLQNLFLLMGAGVLLGLSVALSFQPLASTMRNHKQIRYLMNPLNSIYALGSLAVGSRARINSGVEPIGLDARAPVIAPGGRPPFLIMVLGETTRSGNFGLNGYVRPTTPELEKDQVASFGNVWSCGTSTAASVPCMFSSLGRAAFDARNTDYEGLLDVIQRSGMAVLWLDNQSGCKGTCDRVPNASTTSLQNPQLCPNGACYDEIMLEGLEKRIAALPLEQRERGVVLVLHSMGSHGPAYYQRSPDAFKRFKPECATNDLQNCSQSELLNAYDNSIAYTDHFLASTISWLKTQQTTYDAAMVYIGDHGESLGESNLYLHGLPYAIAPDLQKMVPWITWLSAGFEKSRAVSTQCLKGRRDEKLSHDNLFHSILGLLHIQSQVYQSRLDAYAPCVTRGQAEAKLQ